MGDLGGLPVLVPEPRCLICEEPDSQVRPVIVCDGCLAAAREDWEALSESEQQELLRSSEGV